MITSNDNAIKSRDKLLKICCKSSELKLADFDFFYKCDSLKTRAITGFALGTESLKGGRKCVGTSKITTVMSNLNLSETEKLDSALIKALETKRPTGESVIESYAQALACDPTNKLKK